MSWFKMTPKRKALLTEALEKLTEEIEKGEAASFAKLSTKIEKITVLTDASNEKIETMTPPKKRK